MLPSSHKEIGGYFGFDLNDANQFPYPLAKKYCSARAAFYDLVRNLGIQAIWMPKFICDTMLKPLELLNISIKFYDINEDLYCEDCILDILGIEVGVRHITEYFIHDEWIGNDEGDIFDIIKSVNKSVKVI